VDREQRVRKFTLDNESPIQGEEPQSSFPRPRNLSEIRRRDASPPVNTKSTNAKKSPMPGRHGAKFGRDEASMIDTTSSPWKKSSDYGVQWPNLITMVWRIKM
jgi:hypothetical protein